MIQNFKVKRFRINEYPVFFSLLTLYFVCLVHVYRLISFDPYDVLIRIIYFNVVLAWGLNVIYRAYPNQRIWSFIIVILTMFNFIYLFFFRVNEFVIPVEAFTYVSNIMNFKDSVFSNVVFLDILWFLPITFFLYICKPIEKISRSLFTKKLLYLILLILSFQLVSFRDLDFLKRPYHLYHTQRIKLNYHYHFLFNILFDIKANFCKVKLNKDEINDLQSKFIFNYCNPNAPCNNYNQFNVILILVESLESWPILQKYNGIEITPNLNTLIAKNAVYLNHISPNTSIGRSSDAQFILNTGILPTRNKTTFQSYFNNDFISLSDILKKQFNIKSSFIILGDDPKFYCQNKMTSALGYDYLYSEKNLRMDETFNMGLSDKSLFKQTIPILKKQKTPFFAQIITLSSHLPFEIPFEYKSLDLKNENPLHQYIESIHYFDNALGIFINDLKKNNLYDSTVIFITGDHEGLVGANKKEILDQFNTSKIVPDEYVVPFICINPLNKKHLGLSSKKINQIDLFPTMLNLLNINPYYKGIGIDAFDPKHPNQAFFCSKHESDKIVNSKYYDTFCLKWKLSELYIENNVFNCKKSIFK